MTCSNTSKALRVLVCKIDVQARTYYLTYDLEKVLYTSMTVKEQRL